MNRGLVIAVFVVAALVRGESASGKETASGCPALGPVLEWMRATLVLAAVHRARGSALGAYEVLRSNAQTIAEDSAVAKCGAIPEILARAVTTAAARSTANDAGQAMDLGYAAAFAVALTGRIPSGDLEAKATNMPASLWFSDQCEDIFTLATRLRKGPGSIDVRVKNILLDLHQRPRCPRLERTLSVTGDEALAAAVDAVILDESPLGGGVQSPIARCPELPAVLDRMAAAIAVGARRFNQGQYADCRRLYSLTAESLLKTAIPAGRCPVVRRELLSAIAESSRQPNDSEASWALRRGFDRIAGVLTDRAPAPAQ